MSKRLFRPNEPPLLRTRLAASSYPALTGPRAKQHNAEQHQQHEQQQQQQQQEAAAKANATAPTHRIANAFSSPPTSTTASSHPPRPATALYVVSLNGSRRPRACSLVARCSPPPPQAVAGGIRLWGSLKSAGIRASPASLSLFLALSPTPQATCPTKKYIAIAFDDQKSVLWTLFLLATCRQRKRTIGSRSMLAVFTHTACPSTQRPLCTDRSSDQRGEATRHLPSLLTCESAPLQPEKIVRSSDPFSVTTSA